MAARRDSPPVVQVQFLALAPLSFYCCSLSFQLKGGNRLYFQSD